MKLRLRLRLRDRENEVVKEWQRSMIRRRAKQCTALSLLFLLLVLGSVPSSDTVYIWHAASFASASAGFALCAGLTT